MGRRRNKNKSSTKTRGYRGVQQAQGIYDRQQSSAKVKKYLYYDLMVMIPSTGGSGGSTAIAPETNVEHQLVMNQVLQRLISTGYDTMAWTHTIYGRPKMKEDDPSRVIPSSSFSGMYKTEKQQSQQRPTKRSRTNHKDQFQSQQPKIRILKRLHAVVENLSDMAIYTTAPTTTDSTSAPASSKQYSLLFEKYDIVSVSPRNDVTFQAACASATAASIITLDYTAGRGGVQLPFRIRSSDMKALMVKRSGTAAILEIPYAPALLNPNQRKAWVQTARDVQLACVGVYPPPQILVSSGARHVHDNTSLDMGAMALRSPGDLINLIQTVLQFDSKISYDALCQSGTQAIHIAKQIQLGKTNKATRKGTQEQQKSKDVIVDDILFVSNDDEQKDDDKEQEEEGKGHVVTTKKLSKENSASSKQALVEEDDVGDEKSNQDSEDDDKAGDSDLDDGFIKF